LIIEYLLGTLPGKITTGEEITSLKNRERKKKKKKKEEDEDKTSWELRHRTRTPFLVEDRWGDEERPISRTGTTPPGWG